jgi:hypothetical protein
LRPNPVVYQRLMCCAALLGTCCVLRAQDPAAEKPIENQRVFGVLPNYRTVDGTLPFAPITPKQKLTIALKDSTDYPVFALSGIFAAIYQLEDQSPSYGQGMKGFAKRYAAAYGDQAIGNLFAEGLVPAALHQDPRYFRLGSQGGSGGHRLKYALTRVFVAKNDRGHWTFNSPEWIGKSAAVAISNAYYPEEARNARDNTQKLFIQVGTDALSNVLKEFGPDWIQKLTKKKN